MTQHQPDPAHLPKATPVLSYEAVAEDRTAEWMVRFVGAWVIVMASASVLFHLAQIIARIGATGRTVPWADWTTPALGDVAAIAFGAAIIRRQRYGFYGKMIELAARPVIRLVPLLFSGSFVHLLANIPSLLPTAATFAVLLSVLRRADAKGVLHPVRASGAIHLQEGSNIAFLLVRIGWIYLAQGGMAILHLAIWPLLIWAGVSAAEWSWESSVTLALYLAVGVCGLLLSRRKLWAVWLLAVVLPMQTVGQALLLWWYDTTSGMAFSLRWPTYIMPLIATIAFVSMLVVLARKAAKEGR